MAAPQVGAAPKPPGVRLPSPVVNTAEDRFYALLTMISLLTLGYEMRGLLYAAHNWHEFVHFVHRLLR